MRGFFSLFHLAVVFILWGAAFAGAPSIGGFSFGQTLTYFLVMLVMQFFVGAFNEDYQISEEIRNGLINQFLLKPINYFLYRFSIFAAARLVTGSLGFKEFWNWERQAVREYNGDPKMRVCPDCGHLNSVGYVAFAMNDSPEEREALYGFTSIHPQLYLRYEALEQKLAETPRPKGKKNEDNPQ